MPSVDQNRVAWEGYDWSDGGEEWSNKWGGSRMQWYGTLLPRLRSFLPAATILDLAPGFGRWSYFLKDWAEHLVLVDMSEKAIRGAHERLASFPNVSFHLNDGNSLAMIEDRSVDLVFSFDSLVHVEADVIEGYVDEIAAKLKPDGVAFIHHSNLAAFRRGAAIQGWMAAKCPSLLKLLVQSRLVDNIATQWRGASMSADKMSRFAAKAGLNVCSQELITWTSRRAVIDCITTLTPKGSRWERPTRRFTNPRFMRDADTWSSLAHLYDYGDDEAAALGRTGTHSSGRRLRPAVGDGWTGLGARPGTGSSEPRNHEGLGFLPNRTTKVEPLPGVDVTSIEPPSSVTMP